MRDQARHWCIDAMLRKMLIIYLSLLSACASMTAAGPGGDSLDQVRESSVAASHTPPATGRGWWSIRFGIAWPEEEEASWNMDLYLAHKIIKPVLDQYRSRLELWRFHRRAARDDAGHQFSFSFYSSGEVAELIVSAIKNDKQLAVVQGVGVIEAVQFPDTSIITQPKISDGSDASWTQPVQDSWPYYIMGVSEMWLRLVDEIARRDIANYEIDNYEDILAFYFDVNKTVTGIWRNEGSHAFLHHLNALFGYQETIVVERRYIRF